MLNDEEIYIEEFEVQFEETPSGKESTEWLQEWAFPSRKHSNLSEWKPILERLLNEYKHNGP